jgi:predicted transcriptional regulator
MVITVKEWLLGRLQERQCEDIEALVEAYAREFNVQREAAKKTVRTKLSLLARKGIVVVYKGVACLQGTSLASIVKMRVARKTEYLVSQITEAYEELLSEVVSGIISQHREREKHVHDLAVEAHLALLNGDLKQAEEKLRELIGFLETA